MRRGRRPTFVEDVLPEAAGSPRASAHSNPRRGAEVDEQGGEPAFLPFPSIHVLPDGGLLRLLRAAPVDQQEAWLHPGKYLSAASSLFVLVLNVVLLVRSASAAFQEEYWHLMQHEAADLLAQRVRVGRHDLFVPVQVGTLNPQTRRAMVSAFELAGLLYYLVRLVVLLGVVIRECHARQEGYRYWSSIADLFWDVLPSMRCFSAMRMLRRVHPQILPMEFNMLLHHSRQSPPSTRMLKMALFTAARLLMLFFGFQAFLYKFCTAAEKVQEADSPNMQVLIALGFLNQLMGGVVELDLLMRRRLLLFLFGGEDAVYDDQELVAMRVWTARLAQALHARALRPPLSLKPRRSALRRALAAANTSRFNLRIQWVVAMATWNHIDLQRLVLCEGRENAKERWLSLQRLSTNKAWASIDWSHAKFSLT